MRAGDRDVIVSLVCDGKGTKYVHAYELASSREHTLKVDVGTLKELDLEFRGKDELVAKPRKDMSIDAVGRQVREDRRLLVRSVTWNLQGQTPAETKEVLREKLLPYERYHIVHIGTQECERSIAKSVLNQSKAKWTALLKEVLGPQYAPLVSHTLQATHAIVFIHKGVLPFVRNMRSAAVATGIGTGDARFGNKGGIGIALNVGSTRLLFITAHLTAHQKNANARHSEVHKISGELKKLLRKPPVRRIQPSCGDEDATSPLFFGETKSPSDSGSGNNEDAAPKGGPSASASSAASSFKPTTRLSFTCTTGESSLVDDFDVIVWSGDLNYRVDASRAAADEALVNKDLGSLRALDQLTTAQTQGYVFVGFHEGLLDFPPTYKFDAVDDASNNVDVYDSGPKQRVPSWTDRILWACNDDEPPLHLVEYTSVPDLRSSDHRPVTAAWTLNIDSLEPPDPIPEDPAEDNLHQSEVCLVQ